MVTKEKAIEAWRFSKRAYPEKDYAIYRVGSQWMMTSEGKEFTQKKYKVPIKDWEAI